MHKTILKESGSYLSVLIVDEACEYRDMLGKKLSKFFKRIVYASDSKEALFLYEKEEFSIVIIDIDKEVLDGVNLIAKVQKINSCQSVFVYSNDMQNSSLLVQLLNLGVSCFINKSDELESYYKIFSRICKQKCERKMLMHYIDELEKAQDLPIVDNYATQKEDDFEFFPTPSAEDDDFDFFPTPSDEIAPFVDNSLYKDYFSFLDSDDKEDLKDQLNDIDATLLNAFSEAGGDSASIEILGSFLMKFGNILMNYQFFSDMGMAILEFGKVAGEESQKVAAEASSLQPLISGFCSGLHVFMVEVWEMESENPKFFNDSIINDARLIAEMIVPPQNVDNEDDLVFF